MKKLFYLFGVFSLIVLITISCEKENEKVKNNQLVFSGQLINNSTCKKKTSNETNTSDTLSCVEYTFDNINNKLVLKHINTGFNCCPDSLYVQTLLNGDTIIIQEYEANAPCNCNCLYDLEIELNGIEAKKYQIKFIEPYAIDQQEIIFNLDLKTNIEGEFCVTRKRYPWGN